MQRITGDIHWFDTGTGNVDFARFIGNAGDTVAAPSITWTGDLNNRYL